MPKHDLINGLNYKTLLFSASQRFYFARLKENGSCCTKFSQFLVLQYTLHILNRIELVS